MLTPPINVAMVRSAVGRAMRAPKGKGRAVPVRRWDLERRAEKRAALARRLALKPADCSGASGRDDLEFEAKGRA